MDTAQFVCTTCDTPLPEGAAFCPTCGAATPTGTSQEIAPTRSTADEAEFRKHLQGALGNSYKLGRLVGSGGFAEVYAAQDLRLKRDVAVKVLRSELVPSKTALERFQREEKQDAPRHQRGSLRTGEVDNQLTAPECGINYPVSAAAEQRLRSDSLFEICCSSRRWRGTPLMR